MKRNEAVIINSRVVFVRRTPLESRPIERLTDWKFSWFYSYNAGKGRDRTKWLKSVS